MENEWIRFNSYGTIFKLKIFGYEKDSLWLKTSFRFKFEDVINYKRDNEEVFSVDCIDWLIKNLQKFLSNRIKKQKIVGFYEPDFEFILFPDRYRHVDDTDKDSDVFKIEKYIELHINFWHEGATPNYYSITLEKEDIERLLNYLIGVVSEWKDEKN